jgi:hypothetical protein
LDREGYFPKEDMDVIPIFPKENMDVIPIIVGAVLGIQSQVLPRGKDALRALVSLGMLGLCMGGEEYQASLLQLIPVFSGFALTDSFDAFRDLNGILVIFHVLHASMCLWPTNAWGLPLVYTFGPSHASWAIFYIARLTRTLGMPRVRTVLIGVHGGVFFYTRFVLVDSLGPFDTFEESVIMRATFFVNFLWMIRQGAALGNAVATFAKKNK